MSYILEALRKADQERSAGSVPDLEAVHESSPTTGRSRRWIWALGVILAFNGLLLAVLLLRDGGNEPVPVVEVSPPPEKATVSEPPAPPPAVVLSRPAPRAPSPPVALNKPAPVAAPAPEPPVVPPVVREPLASMPPVSPSPVPEASVSVPAQPAASPGADTGVPYWDDMSLEFRSGFDLPRLDVHVYDSNPQRRFLLIELKKHREGDTLANGALIEEILPDGVQLYHQGTRFIYRK